MQCKDLSTEPILALIAKVERGETFWGPEPRMRVGWGDQPIAYSSATWFGDEFENSVTHAMPGAPPKLALAKMKKLVKQGLVAGCPCGCRGDFILTDAGRKALIDSRALSI